VPSHAAVRPGPFDLYRYQGRHRRPTDTANTARNIAITAGTVAVIMSGDVSPATAAPGMPGEEAWNQLRVCESGNDYTANSGNGYYGAYQFDLQTWRGVGGRGYPNQAAPVEQDRLARALYRERGWSPWTCARILGLTENPVYGYWAPPLTIRSSTSFVQGHQVTVTGSAQAGALVKVYGIYRGQTTPRLLGTVRTGPRGGWTAHVYPTSTVTLQAVAGANHSASVRASMLYRTTLRVPPSTRYNANYTLSGKGHPGGSVTVYTKPYNWSTWLAVRRAPVNGAGNWSMVWRGSTDFVFAVRGDVAGPTRAVRVRPTATADSTADSKTAVLTARQPGTGLGSGHPGLGSAQPRLGSGQPSRAPSTVPITGTARPNTRLTVYVRETGSTAWRALRTITSDAHGNWSTLLSGTGQYAFYAKSANGQASVVKQVSVP